MDLPCWYNEVEEKKGQYWHNPAMPTWRVLCCFMNASNVKHTASMIALIKDQIRNSNCPKGSVWLGSSKLLFLSKNENGTTISDAKKGKEWAASGCLGAIQPPWLNKNCCFYWEFASAHGINSNCPDLGEGLQGFTLGERQIILCHLRPSEDHSILPHVYPERKLLEFWLQYSRTTLQDRNMFPWHIQFTGTNAWRW